MVEANDRYLCLADNLCATNGNDADIMEVEENSRGKMAEKEDIGRTSTGQSHLDKQETAARVDAPFFIERNPSNISRLSANSSEFCKPSKASGTWSIVSVLSAKLGLSTTATDDDTSVAASKSREDEEEGSVGLEDVGLEECDDLCDENGTVVLSTDDSNVSNAKATVACGAFTNSFINMPKSKKKVAVLSLLLGILAMMRLSIGIGVGPNRSASASSKRNEFAPNTVVPEAPIPEVPEVDSVVFDVPPTRILNENTEAPEVPQDWSKKSDFAPNAHAPEAPTPEGPEVDSDLSEVPLTPMPNKDEPPEVLPMTEPASKDEDEDDCEEREPEPIRARILATRKQGLDGATSHNHLRANKDGQMFNRRRLIGQITAELDEQVNHQDNIRRDHNEVGSIHEEFSSISMQLDMIGSISMQLDMNGWKPTESEAPEEPECDCSASSKSGKKSTKGKCSKAYSSWEGGREDIAWDSKSPKSGTKSAKSKGSKTDLCSCTSQPSLSPSSSQQPSISSHPTSTFDPSLKPSYGPSFKPSISSQPSHHPSYGPSFQPSISSQPSVSLQPSISTEPSLQPSISTEPSYGPSFEPSLQPSISPKPSLQPSFAPSPLPSLQPSITLQPSISTQPSHSLKPSYGPSVSSRPSGICSVVEDGNDIEATYNSTLGVPVCSTEGLSCSSGTLLEGRNGKGPELNDPNTLDDCADGKSGTYKSDESLEKITVSSVSGGKLRAGCLVEIEALVYCWSSGTSSYAYFYSARDITNPVWELVGSFRCAAQSGGGFQTLRAHYVLGFRSFQAVRVNFRFQEGEGSCDTSNYGDRDDLVFQVAFPGGPVASHQPSEQPSFGPSLQPSISTEPSLQPSTTLQPPTSTQPSTSTQPTGEVLRVITSEVQSLTSSGQKLYFSFPIDRFESPTSNVQVKVFTRGDINRVGEYYVVTAEDSVLLGNTNNGLQCSTTYTVTDFVILQADFISYIADDMLTIEAEATSEVNLCNQNQVYIELQYTINQK